MPKQTAAVEIRRLQQKLLDLTYRNRLLNLKYDAKSLVRVVDEVPSILFSKLNDDKELQLIGVPEPDENSAEEMDRELEEGQTENVDSRPAVGLHALSLGINPDFALSPKSDGKAKRSHIDNKIQTLLYVDDLDARLHKIYALYKSAIEETGANSLYLTFGALEYTAAESSEDIKRAPLFLFPVRLEKKRNVPFDTYSINSTGEEPEFNISLAEKLRSEFNIRMPEPNLGSEDEFDLDKYSKVLSAAIKKVKPEWKVVLECNLAILNFGKILLYKDLESSFWNSAEAERHPVLSGLLFNEPTSKTEASMVPDLALDDLPRSAVPPLVMDADSSQHSAILLALTGQSLVIQGPPGSGKSQTIANLIAAAIGAGKSVLFVAEKMTALEVVKKRLVGVGLGDFCCELHSTKTQKSALFDSFRARMESSFKSPKGYEAQHSALEQLRGEINTYIKDILKIPDGSQHTVYTLFGRHALVGDRLSEFTKDLEEIEIELGLTLTEKQLIVEGLVLKAHRQIVNSILEQFSSIGNHPWSLLGSNPLRHSAKTVIQALEHTHPMFKYLEEESSKVGGDLRTLLEGEPITVESISMISSRYQEVLQYIAEPNISQIAIESKKISEFDYAQLRNLFSKIIDIDKSLTSMVSDSKSLIALSKSDLNEISSQMSLGAHADAMTLEELPAYLENTRDLLRIAERDESHLVEMAKKLGDE